MWHFVQMHLFMCVHAQAIQQGIVSCRMPNTSNHKNSLMEAKISDNLKIILYRNGVGGDSVGEMPLFQACGHEFGAPAPAQKLDAVVSI